MSATRTIAPVFHNVLEMIGNTPMLELRNLDTGPCRLFVKMESMNPGNSIKDRIAVAMVEAAEKSGALQPGGTIVEPTSGNTGIGLAMVAGGKGFLGRYLCQHLLRRRRVHGRPLDTIAILDAGADTHVGCGEQCDCVIV